MDGNMDVYYTVGQAKESISHIFMECRKQHKATQLSTVMTRFKNHANQGRGSPKWIMNERIFRNLFHSMLPRLGPQFRPILRPNKHDKRHHGKERTGTANRTNTIIKHKQRHRASVTLGWYLGGPDNILQDCFGQLYDRPGQSQDSWGKLSNRSLREKDRASQS